MNRESMVRGQIESRGIRDKAVLKAIRRVPRDQFLPERIRDQAYEDHAVPIGEGQTISQPYIVALMTDMLRPRRKDRILEIGTGSGYQTAVLAELCTRVYSIEAVETLAKTAEKRLMEMDYDNVSVRRGDGYYGWEEEAPFDGIIVTAAAVHVPPALTDQLKTGGRLIIPLGGPYDIQYLTEIRKKEDGSLLSRPALPVRFVPFVGRAQQAGF